MGRDKKTGGDLTQITTRIPAELKASMDAWIAAQRVPPSVTDVVVTAIREFLEREGQIKAAGGAEKTGKEK